MLSERMLYPSIVEKSPLFRQIIKGTDTVPLSTRGSELSHSSAWIEKKFEDTRNEAQMAIPGPIRRWSIEQRRRAWEQAPTPEKRSMVERKIKHTYNVNAKSYWLAQNTLEIQWNMNQVMVNADLHDMGRFPQAIHFQTFTDGNSFNHAVMGALMIENAHLPFEQFNCDEGITLNAVGYHSDRTCPDKPYFHILRDADKLIIAQEYIDDLVAEIAEANRNGRNVSTYQVDSRAIDQFNEGKSIENRYAGQSKSNRILQRISWINDFKFDAAKADFIQSGMFQRLTDLFDIYTENKSELTDNLFTHSLQFRRAMQYNGSNLR
jgi:hypothetical protein